MIQCGGQESREETSRTEYTCKMSVEVPLAKTRHLVGDKNKPQRRKRGPVEGGATRVDNLLCMEYRGFVCVYGVLLCK